MSDSDYAIYWHYGTNAQRLAFTPTPGSGQPIYGWRETDTSAVYLYDTSWHQISGAGSVSLTTGVTGVLPVANGGTGTASGATIIRATITLNNAQIINLPTTSIVIVTAPASGSQINFISGYLSAKFTTGYTGASASNSWLAVTWGGSIQNASSYLANDNTVTPSLGYLTSFLATGNNTAALVPWQDTSIETEQWGTLTGVIPQSSVDNQALELTILNGAVNLGGGNAANSLKVVVYYTIETF